MAVLVVMLAEAMWGQSNRATIQGSISDPAGAVVSGAEVQVTALATGQRRVSVSDARGFYSLAGIESGLVELRVNRDSFRAVIFSRIDLAAGEVLVRDVRLELAGRADALEVQDSGARLRRGTEVGGVMTGTQIGQLPLNGRNWQGLLALIPGAINTGTGDARGVRFFGRGVDDNNFRFDGVDSTGVRNQVPRDDIRLAISMEAIAEFRVRGAMYSAETGGTMAAQVELISRSGSNTLHGSAFEFLRNDKLDARSPFDPAKIPPFRLNQFGGSLGGTLRRDRTFFFAAYEGLAQRLGRSFVATVPSDSFRARALAQTPALRPYLDAFPTSSVATSSPDIARWTGPGSQDNDQHSGTIRIDEKPRDRTSLFARFSTNRMQVRTPQGDSTGNLSAYNRVEEAVTTGVVEWLEVLSPRTVHQARVGINRVPFRSQYESPILPALRVAGLTSIPGARESLVNSLTYTFSDSLSLIRGRHSIKLGVEARPLRFALRTVADGSAIVFTDMNTFAQGRVNTANLNGFLPTRGVSKTQWFAYVQDEIHLTRTLTLNAGLRYEQLGVLKEDFGRAQPFDLETCGGFCPAGTSFTEPDRNNFAPRASLAWAPAAAKGRTVLRVGSGVFYGEGQLGNQTSPVENETVRLSLAGAQLDRVSLADLLAPTLPASAGTLTISPLNLERRRKDMYTTQWTAQVGQELPAGLTLETAYVGSKGSQLFARTYYNRLNPATGLRPLPQYGLIPVRANGANSQYHGLTVALRRARGPATFGANYQWSHAIDEFSAGGDDAGYPQNVSCRACDRASSDFDIRHSFQFNSLYELPFGRGHRHVSHGWGSALLGGWRVGGLFTARSGRALTVSVSRATGDLPDGNATSPQRPDVVSGVPVSLTPDGTANWLNLAAFRLPVRGTWGNAGRSLARGPVIANVDASLTRRLALTERWSLDLRGEVFNVLNHPQFANPQANFSSPATFGRVVQLINTGATGTGTPRQIEFSLRLNF
ncbi:MAG: TonB-dependent receptor [Acidobacteria bacterium]|nr:TonB-dependent receptor [Acidobacteriota bacterium]